MEAFKNYDELVDYLLSKMDVDLSHDSFSIDFEESKLEINARVEKKKINILFDRLTGNIYSHNLSRKNHSYVKNNLYHKYRQTKGKLNRKTKEECDVLFNFIQLYLDDQFEIDTIKKEHRPDFVLASKGQKIGIEVTELGDEVWKNYTLICQKTIGKGYTIDRIKKHAFSKHKTFANKYGYYNRKGNRVIAYSADKEEAIKHYVDQIKRKYKKYLEMLDEFDRFIILCDGRMLSFLDKDYIEEIRQKLISECPNISKFEVCILKEEENLVVEKISF